MPIESILIPILLIVQNEKFEMMDLSKTKIFIIIISTFLCILPGWAKTLTVCTSGCNYTEIQKVFDNNDLDPGDIIEVRADAPGESKTYYETVTWGDDDGGSINQPVTLRAREGDTIIIGGSGDRNFQIGSDYTVVRNIDINIIEVIDANTYGILITGRNVEMDSCKIYYTGASINSDVFQYGMQVRGADVFIHDCEIYNVMIGITVYDATGFAGRIEDNYIHDISVGNEEHADCINFANNGIFTDFVIAGNKLTGWRDDSIDLAFAESVIVENNIIYSPASSAKENNTGVKFNYSGNGNAVIRYNVFHSGNDCGHKKSYAIYNANNGSSGNQIYGNLIYDWSFGILLGSNVDNNDVYNNTILAAFRGISFNDGVSNSDVHNNIIDGGANGVDFSIGDSVSVKGGYNILVRDSGTHVGLGSNYTNTEASDQYETNPLFVSTDDYRLQSSSPAIDAGLDLGSPYDAYKVGRAPDIGAIEYLKIKPSPPIGFRRIP